MLRDLVQKSFHQLQRERKRVADQFGIVVGGETTGALRGEGVAQFADGEFLDRATGGGDS